MGLFGSSKKKAPATDMEMQSSDNGTLENGSNPSDIDKVNPHGEHTENQIAAADHYKEPGAHEHWPPRTGADAANGMQAPQAAYDREAAEDYPQLVQADTQDTLAVVRTVSRVPGNNTYYEKGGLRTYGDGINHTKEDAWGFSRWMLFTAMGFLWTASQIPVYLYGGIIPDIIADIGGADRYVWLLLAYLIPLASITPFVGPLADLFGRKTLALASVVSMIIGTTITSTAHSMNTFVGGMVFNGFGGGILELVALAVVGESAPTAKRGLYIGAIILTILPFCPSVLWAQLIVFHSSWRYVGLWIALWAAVGGILTLIFYNPPHRPNANGLTKWQIVKRIDVTGGLTSTAGLTLLLMSLTWGGNQYAWHSAHVIATMTLGFFFIVVWIVWEIFFVKYPMFPRRLGTNPRALTIILLITFVSGANFFAVLIFWPTQYYVTYANFRDPFSIGEGSLPVGFCIIGGSIIFSILITVLKGKIKIMMIVSTAIMLAGNGAMAAANLNNLGGVFAAVSIACFGVGAVIVPCQVVSTVICPDDLIATITALTISVRFVGGAIGYSVYYNVLRQQYTKFAPPLIIPAAIKIGLTNAEEVLQIIVDLGSSLAVRLHTYPGVNTPEKVDILVRAGQEAYAQAYPIVYYASIAFGAVSVIASFFLPDIDKFMDEHIAVSYH